MRIVIAESRKFDMVVLREAIVAAVLAHGASNILPSEMEIKNPKMLRYAPG